MYAFPSQWLQTHHGTTLIPSLLQNTIKRKPSPPTLCLAPCHVPCQPCSPWPAAGWQNPRGAATLCAQKRHREGGVGTCRQQLRPSEGLAHTHELDSRPPARSRTWSGWPASGAGAGHANCPARCRARVSALPGTVLVHSGHQKRQKTTGVHDNGGGGLYWGSTEVKY